jgi:hypothetical protein
MIATANAGSPALMILCGSSGPPAAIGWIGPNAATSHQNSGSAISG